MGKRELIALLNLSSWCLVMVERLFLAVPRGCLRFVIVVFPDHTNLLFLPIVIGLTTLKQENILNIPDNNKQQVCHICDDITSNVKFPETSIGS